MGRCPVCFLVSRLDSFVFVSLFDSFVIIALFDSFVIIALFDSFNVIARLDRAISLLPSPFLRILRSSRTLRVRTGEAADDGK